MKLVVACGNWISDNPCICPNCTEHVSRSSDNCLHATCRWLTVYTLAKIWWRVGLPNSLDPCKLDIQPKSLKLCSRCCRYMWHIGVSFTAINVALPLVGTLRTLIDRDGFHFRDRSQVRSLIFFLAPQFSRGWSLRHRCLPTVQTDRHVRKGVGLFEWNSCFLSHRSPLRRTEKILKPCSRGACQTANAFWLSNVAYWNIHRMFVNPKARAVKSHCTIWVHNVYK